MEPAPRKPTRTRKPHVDEAVPSVRHSGCEKEAAPQTAAGDPRTEGPARRDATALADAAAFIGKGARADKGDAADSQRSGIEQRLAEEWARAKGRLIDDRELDSLLLISNSTSEHEVWYREFDNRAVKRTWPGFFGQVPIWKAGRLDRAPATPVQYLERQRLQNEVFDGDIILEGVNVSSRSSMIIGEPAGLPSFVISQPFIETTEENFPAPSETQIAALLSAHGFEAVPGSYFGWQRVSDGVVILDARRDNFILSAEGVIPIDLQMAVIPEIIRAKTPRASASKARRKRA